MAELEFKPRPPFREPTVLTTCQGPAPPALALAPLVRRGPASRTQAAAGGVRFPSLCGVTLGQCVDL